MNDSPLSGRKFYRNRTNGIIGGVCAGVADYFGFNLRTTRILTAIACFFFWPAAILIYVGLVLFVPARSAAEMQQAPDPEFRRAMRSAPKTTIGDVHRRFQKLESRLIRIERHVTSPRYNLDREIRNL